MQNIIGISTYFNHFSYLVFNPSTCTNTKCRYCFVVEKFYDVPNYGPYIDNDLMVRMMHHLIVQEKVMSLQKCSIPPQFELVRCTNFLRIQTYLILTKFIE